jgi:hypothetical protein
MPWVRPSADGRRGAVGRDVTRYQPPEWDLERASSAPPGDGDLAPVPNPRFTVGAIGLSEHPPVATLSVEVTMPATNRTEIVEPGRPPRMSSVGSLRSADVAPMALAAPRPGRPAGKPAGTDGSLTKGTGARSDTMSALVAKNVRRHAKSSIGAPDGLRIFSNRQSEGPPLGSCFCRIRTGKPEHDW